MRVAASLPIFLIDLRHRFLVGHLMRSLVRADFRVSRIGIRSVLVIAAIFCSPVPAAAIVGGAPATDATLARSVVTIVGSRGNFCSGALIAPDLVLSAAHCVSPDATYKIVSYDDKRQPKLLDVRRVALHPRFNAQGILAHRASADVALLQLAQPMSAKAPAPLGAPNEPIVAGTSFIVIGIGVTRHGDGKSGGTARTALLVATGRPGNLQIRLIDPATNNVREGLGACTGDSGAPVYREIGSWSTGPALSDGCGGLTGVTPLTRYRAWIVEQARKMGAPLSP